MKPFSLMQGRVLLSLTDLVKIEEEKPLFSLFQKAYIDTRYKEDYKISTDDLLSITEKVKLMHKIFEKELNDFLHPSAIICMPCG